ncbi:MAG: ankyrin repeat domain-containing protein [Burkholderiales bacterium]|nr:ankyrin repeat domain-containing protein [Burkholderiales bacterium]
MRSSNPGAWLWMMALLALPPAFAFENDTYEWLAKPADERRIGPAGPLDFARIKATGNDGEPLYAAGKESALIDAVARNDVAAVDALLKEEVNVNARDEWGVRPLIHAARNGAVEMVRVLLDAGAAPDVKGGGFTPLAAAALNGHTQVVTLLLKAGAMVDMKSDNGCTPLMNAVLMNHARVVAEILKYDPDLTLTNPERMTALSIAAAEGYTESLEAMLKYGIDPNLIDRNKNPPLFWAVFRGQRGAIRVLLEYGAEPGTMAVDL